MAKVQSFADKMNKATADHTTHCAKCGESIQAVKVVKTEKSEKTGACKFRESFVGMCKCNKDNLV